MRLHRALMCGTGFYDWLVTNPVAIEEPSTRVGEPDPSEAMAALSLESRPTFKRLPTINYMAIDDQRHIDVLLEEALPHDRDRFRRYMSDRPLGLGLMTAGPGFGKTTAMAVVTLVMHARLGKILGTGPSNVSVDNLAARIYNVGASVASRYNSGNECNENRKRRPLVIRGYKDPWDLDAFSALIINNGNAQDAVPKGAWGELTKWQLPFSLCYWMLVLFRSPFVPELHVDDKKALHDLRDDIDRRPDLRLLREVVAGRMTWADFEPRAKSSKQRFTALMSEVLDQADIVCVTSALAENDEHYKSFRDQSARGIVVDEAANMHRADLAGVWGNTLLPCFLGGDPRQLPPTVLTDREVDMGGNFFNRLPKDGGVSPLAFFQGGGMPVYRLRTQLRMAKGLFDLDSKLMYPDVPFTYGPSCDVSLAKFTIGRSLEDFARDRYPDLSPPPEGTLSPLFVHCEGSRVFKDPMTGSKKSPDQVRAALSFAADFVKAKGVNPSLITVITPYTFNAELVEKLRRSAQFDNLKDMPRAATIDSFQGQENDIVIVVMGTNQIVGPGFTTEKQRLNVLLTRARCGLVIFGDINTVGKVTAIKKKETKAVAKGKKRLPPILVESSTGERAFVNANELQMLHQSLWEAGRVATLVFEKPKKAEEKSEKMAE